MDEPMEMANVENGAEDVQSSDNRQKTTMLRGPASMVMMTITVEDYEREYWPKLENAIAQLLTLKPGDYIPISYEQMYSCVYKCVCKQFSERLYSDLLKQISDHLERITMELQHPDPQQYIERFHYATNQYLQALGGIVPIFNYMNRFYVESKLKTDLSNELRKLYINIVCDKHMQALIPLLVDANMKPFAIAPKIMATLIKNIFDLNREYAALHPHLFAKYLPNILPPSTEADIERHILETKQLQRDLLANPDYISGDQSRKRPGEDQQHQSSHS